MSKLASRLLVSHTDDYVRVESTCSSCGNKIRRFVSKNFHPPKRIILCHTCTAAHFNKERAMRKLQ